MGWKDGEHAVDAQELGEGGGSRWVVGEASWEACEVSGPASCTQIEGPQALVEYKTGEIIRQTEDSQSGKSSRTPGRVGRL